jgi:selenocysteine-specific elongation factor
VPAALPVLGEGDARAKILAAIGDAGWKGLEDGEAAAIAGVGPEAARKDIEQCIRAGEIRGMEGSARRWHRSAVEDIGRKAAEALSRLHDRFPEREGFPQDEVSSALPGAPAPALVALSLSGIADAGKTGDLHFLAARRPRSVELSSPLARAITEKVRLAGLNALSRNEIAESVRAGDPKAFDKTLEGLARAGAVVRVKELYFDPASVEALKGKVVSFLVKRGEITVPEFKELTGLTRKYLIPLLEHFDLTKVTLRVGDKRVLRKGK